MPRTAAGEAEDRLLLVHLPYEARRLPVRGNHTAQYTQARTQVGIGTHLLLTGSSGHGSQILIQVRRCSGW